MAYGSGKTWTKGLWIGVDPGFNPPGVAIIKHFAKNVTITPIDNLLLDHTVDAFVGEGMTHLDEIAKSILESPWEYAARTMLPPLGINMELPPNGFVKFTAVNNHLAQDIHDLRADACPCRACGNFNKTDGSYPCRLKIDCPDVTGSATCPTCPLRKCEHYTNCVVYDGLG